jgi:hypothetical protein
VPEVTRLLGTHFNHVCAAVIVATLLGTLRLVRAYRSVLGPSVVAQLLLLAWLALLLVATYAFPPLGIWGVGLVVPLFADHHAFTWLVGRVGAEPLIGGLRAAVRGAGPVRFVLASSTQQAIHAALGLIIITVSEGRNTWEYWLGYGVLSSAGLGVVGHALAAARLLGTNGQRHA